jgi:ligand-binding sensor domain-containing protein/DNA-binding CsgD family transcriptional regulator
MKRILLLLPAVFGACFAAMGQNTVGTSNIVNYKNQAYGGGSQNWDIKQDKNGILYFANNDGLLTFDGSYWKLYPLPNKTVVRSLEIGIDGKIYVGGQNEIGFFSPDARGDISYTSLLPMLPASQKSFADVWNIVTYNGDVFFRTSGKIMRLGPGGFTIYPNDDWRFLGTSNHQLIAQDHANRLWTLVNNSWQTSIDQHILPKDFLITSFVRFSGDTSMVTTLKNGVYLLSKNILTKLTSSALTGIAEKNIYKSLPIDNGFLLATSLGGCFLMDKQGNLVQSFSTFEGLQNNNVRHLFLDKGNNLWLGLDNGIDFIAYNNAIKEITPDKENKGAGYAAIIYNDALYLGTSNGLYSMPLEHSKNISLAKGQFRPVAKTQGQVWSLAEVNGKLLMAHHEGSFIINNNTAEPFDNSSGFWNFFPLSKQPDIMLAGNYQGINFYNFANNKFVNPDIHAHFESSRIIAVDNKNIWVAHPYKGIYKINFNPPASTTIQMYGANKGLSSVNHYYVYKIRNRIIVPTEKDFFEYDSTADSFERSAFFEKLFGDIRVNYLKEDPNGNIWFTSEKNLGVIDFSGKEPKTIYITELTGKIVRGFEFIYPIDINNIIVGGEEGFYHINYEKYRRNDNQIQVLVRTVKALPTDSLIFGGYVDKAKTEMPELSYRFNSMHFDYSSNLYGQQSNVEYSYFLKGFDNGWSDWFKKTDKEYTNLPAGSYTFQVKARNNLGNESAPVAYSFRILPPWYASRWAYLFYCIAGGIGIYLLSRRQKLKFKNQRVKYEEEQQQLQYLHQLEIDRNEKVIVQLKNEKLETEINHQHKELAAATMHLVQKGELLKKIREEMSGMLKNVSSKDSLEEVKRIIRMMTDNDKFDQDWEQFSFHFDRVHGDFLTSLKNKFANLTPIELKLCAYLRMNLSTKEMAQLMNISVRGVEVSRYRLRKKLNIPTEINLADFLVDCVKETSGGQMV